MERLTTENDAAANERTGLAKVLLNNKARIDQLESDTRQLEKQQKKYQTKSQKKQAQLETYQKENKALKKCKLRA